MVRVVTEGGLRRLSTSSWCRPSTCILLREYRAKTESRQTVVGGGKGGVKIFQR